MTTFKFPKREETPERYDSNREINNLIQEAFKRSVSKFSMHMENIAEVTDEQVKLSSDYFDVPYAEKNIGRSGCAVLCMEHGLRTRGIQYNIEELAKEIGDKGYYFPGRGTWHNLYDHYGLRRASDVEEIFATLRMGKIVTILLQNSVYVYGGAETDSHFVNIVGVYEGNTFIVDDPKFGRVSASIQNIFEAARVAWVW